ncbi:ComF family protein [Roseobacter sp. HKCCD9010]|uniref:ComF family protein n=1 Tax=unclassified Roseobacter TaxID=196798 RepID=UPI001492C037|nr:MULTISPECIES: ComF family protein [unclassified Roseobacter]MBF9051159.1 ComF family protein [Rhodobacterales bacterium HKCCD4356]NNV12928.1 ComF family protein [Roseobacter sp. HKCCD7357]NNV16873.1 ComF family protein [Roseobacter sp. HKCCD8768]NNV26495.1 ComF family protein [Roseobacter sp. HKCCD8192]NNV30594.1 ComF family protein [Roseobacter sp. HKCCD9061]
MRLQTAIHAVFPPECLCCGARVESDYAICGACWGDTPFIHGTACDQCGVPLPGAEEETVLRCDECLQVARPWSRGRAVFVYGGNARRLVLGLKHGDRADVAKAAGPWMAARAAPLLTEQSLIVPIPLHRWRLLKRRYNQSALLAHALGRAANVEVLPDALIRPSATQSQDGLGYEKRFENLESAIRPHPKHGAVLAGRDVLLIDDVMTSGATFSAATDAAFVAGAKNVCVIALARAAKDA